MSTWYICHHGILGQKWGVRRYQNTDGTLTPEGQKRYLSDSSRTARLRRKLEKVADQPDSPKKVIKQTVLTKKLQASMTKDERKGNYKYAVDQYKLRDRFKDNLQYGMIGASKVKKYLGYSGKSLQEARDLMDREREYKQYDREVKRLKREAKREKRRTGYDSYKANLETAGKDYTGTRKLADVMQKGFKYEKQVMNAVGYKNMPYSEAMAFASERSYYEQERKQAREAWKG